MFSGTDFTIKKCQKANHNKAFGLCSKKVIYLFSSKCVEMMGLIGAGNNPMVGMTVAPAVAVNEALNK